MKLQLFSVYDRASCSFGRPFYVPSSGVALRSFTDEVNNPQSDLAKHPSDYELHELGEFDDATAEFNLLVKPSLITTASQVLVKEAA